MKEGDFLREKYQDLHTSEEVESAVHRKEVRSEDGVPNEPAPRIEAYLGRLEEIFEHPKESVRERLTELFREKLHEQFIIQSPEEIPEGYLNLQRKLARERGHGEIEITDEMKDTYFENLSGGQKKSLDIWIDYLGSEDAPYPTWFKYFAVRSILGLSQYDKEKKEFPKRAKTTVSPFPELDREALAYVADILERSRIKGEKVEDKEWEKLLAGANFAKLYAKAIAEVTPATQEQKEIITGAWVKYPQGSDPKPLCESLQGHGTGWCTAYESTAREQLEAGDFYVYYSTDKSGKNTVPRVAIRMEGDEVGEVRGINKGQDLELSFIDIANEKMKDLGGAEKYAKRTADMKRLTLVEKKVNAGEALTNDELLFLYEVGTKIEGFGYEEDPRIAELIMKRDRKADLTAIIETKLRNTLPKEWTENDYGEAMVKKMTPILLGIDSSIQSLRENGELDYFFVFPKYKKEMLVRKESPENEGKTVEYLQASIEKFSAIEENDWNKESVKTAIWEYSKQEGGDPIIWPIGVALSGREDYPNSFGFDKFMLAEILGKHETLARLRRAIQILSE